MTISERRSQRPKVRLTVGRRVSDGAPYKSDPLLRTRVTETLIHHDWPILHRLAYVCVSCGSVGECASQEARDLTVAEIDFTCHQFDTCGPNSTVTFKTEEV